MRTWWLLAAVLAVGSLLPGCLSPSQPGGATTHPPASAASDPPARTSWSLLGTTTGGEPSLGLAKDGSVLVLAGDEVYHGDGATWKVVHSFEKAAGQPGTSDPWMFVDPVDGTAYVDQMFPILACTWLTTSADAGATWSPEAPACPSPVVDFQKLVTAPRGPEPNPLAASASRIVVQCYNKPVFDFVVGTSFGRYGMACAASYDGGHTWHETVLDNTVEGPAGVHVAGCSGGSWIPAAAPDGTLVVRSQPSCLYRSRDSGATWSAVGTGPKEFMGTQLGFDANGTLYALSGYWEGHTLRYAVSRDQGATWSPARTIDLGGRAFGLEALATGPAGRLGVALMAAPGNFTSDKAPENTTWTPWMLEVRAADTDAPQVRLAQVADVPVDSGCLARQQGCLFLGDFMRAVYAPDGSLWAAYPDACAGGRCGDGVDVLVGHVAFG